MQLAKSTVPRLVYKSVPLILVLALVGSGSVILRDANANGWEHTAIDFAVLTAALDDSNPRMRQRAAESLGFRRQPTTSQILIARLAKMETDAQVRQSIYAALGKLGATDALPSLAECLSNEIEIAVRMQCARVLGGIKTPASAELALTALADKNDSVRLEAIGSLGFLTTPTVVPTLVKLTRSDNPAVRNKALLALGQTGSNSAIAVLVDALEQSRDTAQTLIALNALTLLAQPSTAVPIRRVYTRSVDEVVKRHALVALANTRAGGSQTQFLDALSSHATSTRMLGLSVLRKFASGNEVPAIVEHGLQASHKLFAGDNERLLQQPLRALADLQLLNAYLQTVVWLDPAAAERLYLRAAVSRTIPRHSATLLKIADELYKARWQALYGLGYTGTARASKVISAALNDADARIRAVATRSLGVLQDLPRVDSIIAMLSDSAAEVRWTAARVLGRWKAPSAAPYLLTSLQDVNAQVRLEAALALGYLNAPSARQKLTAILATDRDERVRDAAIYALSLIDKTNL